MTEEAGGALLYYIICCLCVCVVWVGRVRARDKNFIVISFSNRKSKPAAAVKIEAVLGDQTATATLDYVPGHGEAKAYFRFDANPRTAVVRVQGWSAP